MFTLGFLILRAWDAHDRVWALSLSFVLVPVLGYALYQRFFGMARLGGLLQEMESGGQKVTDLLGVISKGRVFGSFLNSNMLAGFLAVFLPLTLDLALTVRGRGHRLIFSMLAAAQFVVLVLTGSIGGSLAASAAAAAVFLFRKRLRRRGLIWMAGLGVILIAGLLMVRGVPMGISQDNSGIQRIGYMKAGILMAAERPFFGWGAGSTPGALMGYVSPGVRPVTDPHNFLVRSWIAWGLPGVVILIFFIFLWGKKVLDPVKKNGWGSMPAGYGGLLAGSLAFLLHSLIDMDFFVSETALFGWVFMGGSLGVAARQGNRQGGGGKEPPGKRFRWMAAAALLALAIPSLIFSQGEFKAYKGQRAMEGERYKEAASLYREAGRLIPFSGQFILEEGRARRALGQKETAAVLFTRASEKLGFSPYPHWELGRLALGEENWEGSIPHLEKALERYPTSPRINLDLAQAYHGMGDDAAAVRFLEEARKCSVFDPEVRSFFQ